MRKYEIKKGVLDKCIVLTRKIAEEVNDERSSKCGYDLFMGIKTGNVEQRIKAWNRYLVECKNGEAHVSGWRDDIWVPAL
jgi:hypothetical protein